MLCPVCDTRLIVINSRPKGVGVTNRLYDCPECFTRVNTTEKINYDKLPRNILNILHEKAERARR